MDAARSGIAEQISLTPEMRSEIQVRDSSNLASKNSYICGFFLQTKSLLCLRTMSWTLICNNKEN